ncbi:hypothetical protein SPHINGO361_100445 [Sphingomonas sp. EC-HK361]|nr:hypothetical protein SPHINGO361_100445 [Sphingomonas sp. EC-HK361]
MTPPTLASAKIIRNAPERSDGRAVGGMEARGARVIGAQTLPAILPPGNRPCDQGFIVVPSSVTSDTIVRSVASRATATR